jgi:pimeloyl-ACP methyl ester carboxylesterase
MPKRSTLLLGAAAAVGAGAVFALRRFHAGLDTTAPSPLSLPDGEDRVLESADGAKLEVRIAGPADAPSTIVLTHGWTNDRRVWGAVATTLVEAGHRVVLWNQRGHGGSTGGNGGYTIDAIGSDVRTVLEQLDLRDVVLVGHSMGGMASMAFLTQHPDARDRVAGLALVATGSSGVGARGGRVAEAIAAQTIAHPRTDRAVASSRLGPLLVRGAVGRRPAQAHLQAVSELFVATPPDVRAGFLRAMTRMDLADAVRELDVPAVVVVGRYDQLTPPALSRRLVDAIPGARLELLDDVGHMLPIEAPDRIAAIVDDLVRSAVLGVLEVEAAPGVPG